jgi:hypothetical protein
MDLARMSDLIYLNLTVSQVQGGVGLTRMLNPVLLDVAVSQVQKLLDLIVYQA